MPGFFMFYSAVRLKIQPCRGMICKAWFVSLKLLDPPIVDAIFSGRAPWSLSLTKLDTNLPYSWKEQMKLFGME